MKKGQPHWLQSLLMSPAATATSHELLLLPPTHPHCGFLLCGFPLLMHTTATCHWGFHRLLPHDLCHHMELAPATWVMLLDEPTSTIWVSASYDVFIKKIKQNRIWLRGEVKYEGRGCLSGPCPGITWPWGTSYIKLYYRIEFIPGMRRRVKRVLEAEKDREIDRVEK